MPKILLHFQWKQYCTIRIINDKTRSRHGSLKASLQSKALSTKIEPYHLGFCRLKIWLTYLWTWSYNLNKKSLKKVLYMWRDTFGVKQSGESIHLRSIHATPEKIEILAFFLRFGPPSTLICLEIEPENTHQIRLRNYKKRAFRFRVDGKHFKNEAFRKLEFSWNTNRKMTSDCCPQSAGADLGGGCRGCAPSPPKMKLSSSYIRIRF